LQLDKEKLLESIKQALGEQNISNAIKSGNKEKILNSLPTETKNNINELLSDNEKMKQLLNSKEAKEIIAKFLKDK